MLKNKFAIITGAAGVSGIPACAAYPAIACFLASDEGSYVNGDVNR